LRCFFTFFGSFPAESLFCFTCFFLAKPHLTISESKLSPKLNSNLSTFVKETWGHHGKYFFFAGNQICDSSPAVFLNSFWEFSSRKSLFFPTCFFQRNLILPYLRVNFPQKLTQICLFLLKRRGDITV